LLKSKVLRQIYIAWYVPSLVPLVVTLCTMNAALCTLIATVHTHTATKCTLQAEPSVFTVTRYKMTRTPRALRAFPGTLQTTPGISTATLRAMRVTSCTPAATRCRDGCSQRRPSSLPLSGPLPAIRVRGTSCMLTIALCTMGAILYTLRAGTRPE